MSSETEIRPFRVDMPDEAIADLRRRDSPVRIQWDPERSLILQPLPWRSVQIGLSGEAAAKYVHEWITSIADITPLAERMRRHVSSGDLSAARAEMPAERVYPLPASISTQIGASPALPGLEREQVAQK